MLINRRLFFFLGSVTALASRGAFAQTDDNPGPFGLVYGSSSDEVQQSGVHLAPLSGKSDWGATFTATGLSKVLSDMESPVLSFGFRNRLWRIAAAGRTIGADPYGNAVSARYEEIKSSLSQRYGRGEETDLRDREIWKGPDEYIMSVKQGRAFRFTNFETHNATVELSIRALSSDSAYYLIIYASKPESRGFDKDKRDQEKNAL